MELKVILEVLAHRKLHQWHRTVGRAADVHGVLAPTLDAIDIGADRWMVHVVDQQAGVASPPSGWVMSQAQRASIILPAISTAY
jgi:hypothetical protein